MQQAVYGAWCAVFDVVKSDMDRPLNSCVRKGLCLLYPAVF